MSVKKFELDLRKYRKLKGWSQQRLALELGISQSYLSALENNTYTHSPSLELIDKACGVLNVCLFDVIKVVSCTGTCERCRHKISINSNDQEEVHYYL